MPSRKTILTSLACGEVASWFFLIIFYTLEFQTKAAASFPVLPVEKLAWSVLIVFPLLFLFGLFVAYFLGKFLKVFYQLVKFVEVGVLNTLVDLGILSLLMAVTGIAGGIWYPVFKAISFLTATTNSYFWNKIWTFQKEGFEEAGKEFSEFLIVSGVGLGINVGSASVVVNWIGPQFGLSSDVWGVIGGIIAALCGMTWNFLGYKFLVFNK
ncbi:MAG: GtrA family protein [Candidatus Paceibacterota bacterium]